MSTRTFVTIVVAGLTAAGPARAEDPKLGVVLDATYVSRYIWRGLDSYPNDHSAIQPSVDIDFYQTGFGMNVWWSRANQAGFENGEESDYSLYYSDSLFEDEIRATEFTVCWLYYGYPDEPKRAGNLQEACLTLSWPNVCPAGVVPSYTIAATWPAESESDISDYSGWVHILGLSYDLTMAGFVPGTEEQIVSLSAEAVYTDGAYGMEVDHDWSHAVFGVSTSFDLGNGVTFTPGFYYQSSWDDSINTSDEYWVALGVQREY